MTDIKEKLSALYDGELESSQIDDLLEECRNNDELKHTGRVNSRIH